jgi:predicted TIM-barrel fold metal-dependent hydrolase
MVEAANGWLADRIMYAAAFPSTPLRETLEAFTALPFTDEARRKVLHDNAASFLGLSGG